MNTRASDMTPWPNLILRFFIEAQHAFGHVVIRDVEAVVQWALVPSRVLFHFQLLTQSTGRCWILGAVTRFTFVGSFNLCFSTEQCLWSVLISFWHLVVHSRVHAILGTTVWVRLTGPAPVKSLKPVTPHRLAAQMFIRSNLSEVRYRYADIPMTRRGQARGVVGVWDGAGAVQSPPHPGEPLLGSPPYWRAVVGPAVQVICQDHAVSVTAVHVLLPERGIPAPAHLQI